MRQTMPTRAMCRLITLTFVLGLIASAALASSNASVETAPPDAARFAKERERIIEHLKGHELSEQEVRDWIAFAEQIKRNAKEDLTLTERFVRAVKNPWVFFGLAAQGIFMMRFVVQLIASERKKRSHVPIAFWYLSLVGGIMLFVYALARRDPVFVLGQGLGIFIYARNLMLIRNRHAEMIDRLDDRAGRARVAAEISGPTPRGPQST